LARGSSGIIGGITAFGMDAETSLVDGLFEVKNFKFDIPVNCSRCYPEEVQVEDYKVDGRGAVSSGSCEG